MLKFGDMYNYNISVASCGSSLNYRQVELLVRELGVTEIIIAYDKEYEKLGTEEATKYFYKLQKICQKYSNYCNFYFLYDYKNLLELKDSPIDKGKETFEKLIKDKVKVN